LAYALRKQAPAPSVRLQPEEVKPAQRPAEPMKTWSVRLQFEKETPCQGPPGTKLALIAENLEAHVTTKYRRLTKETTVDRNGNETKALEKLAKTCNTSYRRRMTLEMRNQFDTKKGRFEVRSDMVYVVVLKSSAVGGVGDARR
jgi:hypothetical protein